MPSSYSLSIPLFVVGILALIVFLFIQVSDKWSTPISNQEVISPSSNPNSSPPLFTPTINTPTPTISSMPGAQPDFTSGSSRFSQGSCTQHSDCIAAGCSGEVCTNQDNSNVISTCDWSDSFPNAQGYNCACVGGICGWTK